MTVMDLSGALKHRTVRSSTADRGAQDAEPDLCTLIAARRAELEVGDLVGRVVLLQLLGDQQLQGDEVGHPLTYSSG